MWFLMPCVASIDLTPTSAIMSVENLYRWMRPWDVYVRNAANINPQSHSA
jgi:hypothetical protein